MYLILLASLDGSIILNDMNHIKNLNYSLKGHLWFQCFWLPTLVVKNIDFFHTTNKHAHTTLYVIDIVYCMSSVNTKCQILRSKYKVAVEFLRLYVKLIVLFDIGLNNRSHTDDIH